MINQQKDSRNSAQRRTRARAIAYYKGFKCLFTWGISRDNQLPTLVFGDQVNQYYNHLQSPDLLDNTNTQIATKKG